MKKRSKYCGVIVPMVTPFKVDGGVDRYAVKRIVELFKQNGAHPFVLGTTGEGPSVRQNQKDIVVAETVAAADGKCTVYAGISSNAFAESVEMATRYGDMGVDVVVATLPAFYPLDDNQMLRYFEALADASPCPLIIYNMPATVKMSISLDVLDQLSHHPNIVGVKDSERDISRLDKSLDLWRDRSDFVHLIGWAAQSSYAMQNGSAGIVPSTGNFAPGFYEELLNSVEAGNFERGDELQDITNQLGLLYQKDRTLSQSIPALKYIMSVMGFCGPNVLPPMYRMSEEDEEAYRMFIEEELVKYELIV
ncbi:dihydrodipicolinate synthase family protein [Saccharicrinis sp. FJH2]|uniref:dihydrodipicolinate synthase family protein n=1 Tax=Saccharicrinis sp. FJH65 TaxID=3344659 RepID=UPI0035F255AF